MRLRKWFYVLILFMLVVKVGLMVNINFLQDKFESYEIIAAEPIHRDIQKPSFEYNISKDTNVTRLTTSKDQIKKSLVGTNLQGLENILYDLGMKYHVDPGFALSIFVWETGWGDSPLWKSQNNPAGIRCGIDYCSYSTKEEGIQSVFALLHAYTQGTIKYVGMRLTPEDIRSVWSEADDTEAIVKIWKQIEGENKIENNY